MRRSRRLGRHSSRRNARYVTATHPHHHPHLPHAALPRILMAATAPRAVGEAEGGREVWACRAIWQRVDEAAAGLLARLALVEHLA
eukprot:COSAG06_NODE_4745_length_3984_cov_1.280864_2_plen_86_part_00